MIYSRIAGMIVFIMLVTSLYKPVFIDTDEIIFGISEDHKQIISTVVEEEEHKQLMNLSKAEIHSETDAMFASALDAYRKEQGNKKASNTKNGYYILTAYTWTGNAMANGQYPYYGAVASNDFAIGTILYIDGYGTFTVCDTGGMGHGVLDIYLNTEAECWQFGRQSAYVSIISQ